MATDAYGSAADHQGLSGLTVGDPHTQYANWQQGTFAARPIQPVRAGVQFLATDVGVLYVSNGGAWVPVLGKSDTQVSRDLSQTGLMGGGIISWDITYLKWTARFIAISVGRGSQWTTDGYTEIVMPTNGTVIPGYGGSGSVTVTASGIPFSSWQALYWIRTVGGAFNAGSFAMVHYTSDFVIPSNWIFIAGQNADDGRIKLGTGQMLDYWRTPTLNSPYSTTPGGYQAVQYMKDSRNFVVMRGYVGSTATGNSTMFTLPAGFRPAQRLSFVSWGFVGGYVISRIDVLADGSVLAVSPTNGTDWALTSVAFAAEA